MMGNLMRVATGTVANLLVLVCLAASPALLGSASAIEVDSTADNTTGGDSNCTLREAINNANADADTTGGDCDAGVGDDEITFAANTNGTPITLAGASGEDANASGDLDLTDSDALTITGNGPAETIIQAGVAKGGGVDRAFHALGGDATFFGLTIRNSGLADERGGAIFGTQDAGSSLTVDECVLEDNIAEFAAGIYFNTTEGQLFIWNSTLENNMAQSATASGGAMRVIPTQGSLEMVNSRVIGNMADDGAGVDFDATFGTAKITDSVISGNMTTSDGAGIRMTATIGMMTITGSTISGNMAGGNGGGIQFRSTQGTLTITNSTICGNEADGDGGGIFEDSSDGTINLNFVTIASNDADKDGNAAGDGGGLSQNSGLVNLNSTILSDNTDTGGEAPDCDGTVSSLGFNLIEDTTGCTGVPAANDITGVSADLGPLDDNGGLTPTKALDPSSPAIDAANDSTCPQTDQRGFFRGSECDIGAFELDGLLSNPRAAPVVGFGGLAVLVVLLLAFGVVSRRRLQHA